MSHRVCVCEKPYYRRLFVSLSNILRSLSHGIRATIERRSLYPTFAGGPPPLSCRRRDPTRSTLRRRRSALLRDLALPPSRSCTAATLRGRDAALRCTAATAQLAGGPPSLSCRRRDPTRSTLHCRRSAPPSRSCTAATLRGRNSARRCAALVHRRRLLNSAAGLPCSAAAADLPCRRGSALLLQICPFCSAAAADLPCRRRGSVLPRICSAIADLPALLRRLSDLPVAAVAAASPGHRRTCPATTAATLIST